MNVLHISTPRSWRGGEQQLAYLGKELGPLVKKQVFFCAKGGALEKFARLSHWNVESFNPNILGMLSNARRLKRICKNQKIDLIHIHDSKAHTLAYVSSLLGNPAPVIVSRRVDFAVGENVLSRKKYNHPLVRKVICVSAAISRIMEASIEDKSKLCVVYDGIDIEHLRHTRPLNLHKEFGIPEHYTTVGNIAALAPHKDYFTWIDTAELLISANHKIKFLIIGEGPMEDEIRKYINDKGLEDDIIMTGFRKDAKAILAALDVFFISSETEGLGSSILDAFAFGIPVVATEAGGIPEIVRKNITGLTAPVKATERLSVLIQKFLNDNELRRRITSEAAEFVKNFDKKYMALATYEVYQEELSVKEETVPAL